MNSPISVAMIEDDPKFRDYVHTIIQHTPGLRLAGAYGQANAAIQQFQAELPQVVLVDLELPGLSGEEAIVQIASRSSRTAIVVLTAYDEPVRLFGALEAGAVGYLVKPITPVALVQAIHLAHEGGAPMSNQVARLVLQTFRRRGEQQRLLDRLTERETAVLRAIASGDDMEEVATKLAIKARTVQSHLRRIYEKLQVHSRVQAVTRFLGGHVEPAAEAPEQAG